MKFHFLLHPYLKIIAVVVVSAGLVHFNYLLFSDEDIAFLLRANKWLMVPGLFYLITVFHFFHYYRIRKQFLHLGVWLVFNFSLLLNFIIYISGNWPPYYIQYSQSGSLFVYAFLLLFYKDSFPNWLRIFSAACFLVLVPCLIYYFAEMWNYYEITVYVLCITPIIKSFVFLKEIKQDRSGLLDA